MTVTGTATSTAALRKAKATLAGALLLAVSGLGAQAAAGSLAAGMADANPDEIADMAPSTSSSTALPVTLAPTPNGRIGSSVEVPSLDTSGGRPVGLRGFWFAPAPVKADSPSPSARPQGTLVLLHGCGGAYRAKRAGVRDSAYRSLDMRFAEVVDMASDRGWAVLVLDSFTARGLSAICQQRTAERTITQRERRRDVLGALNWLAARADVDSRRIALVGWSHGGSAVLASLDASHPEVAASALRPAWAIAHYPGCEASRSRAWFPTAPLLILAGQADDWTPSAPCRALVSDVAARVAPGVVAPQLIEYPEAFHSFDGRSAVRVRMDVPNGVRPGAGVHVGRNEAAAQDARRQLEQWLMR